MMSTPEDHGDVFLDEDDIVEEINIDDEDLPDADSDAGSDTESFDEAINDSVQIFTRHTGEVYTVACSPTDATLVATGGGDNKGFLWKIGHGDFVSELEGHRNSVSCVSFSSDGLLVASGSFDGVIRVWDISSKTTLKCTLDGPVPEPEPEPGSGIEWVRWHPRGHVVLAGTESKDSSAWMWDADMPADMAYLNTFSGHASTVTCGDFTPDGKTICTGSDDASLRIWNPKTGIIHDVSGHGYHTEGITCLAITADSSFVLTGSKDGSVHKVNISTGRVVASLTSHTGSIECIGVSSSSSWVATGSMDQKLIIWENSLVRCTCEHEEGVTCLLWIGGSRYVATGCVDGKVRVWDSRSGVCVKILRGHGDVVQSIAVSADRKHLVSVSLDGTTRVFEIDEFH